MKRINRWYEEEKEGAKEKLNNWSVLHRNLLVNSRCNAQIFTYYTPLPSCTPSGDVY